MALAGNGGAEEVRQYKRGFAGGLIVLSAGIGMFNTTGAWVVSGQNPYWTAIVAGAEVMMLFALSLAVLRYGSLWWRFIASFIITFALAWFCVQNGKFAVRIMFADVFQTEDGVNRDPDTLRAQAGILRDSIPNIQERMRVAEIARQTELQLVRDDIAKLEVERDLMLVEVTDVTSYNRDVQRAQQSLQAKGEYTGSLDGIYGPLTRDAMISRGNAITGELAVLAAREKNLDPVAAVAEESVSLEDISSVNVRLTPDQIAEAGAEKLEEDADTMEGLERWAEQALWTVEAARAFSVWAFLMSLTAKTAPAGASREEDEGTSDDDNSKGDGDTSDDPKNDNQPDIDPDAPMTPEEKGEKGNEAKNAYNDAENATVIEIGPVLSTDGKQEDAA
jgi:hypothetical protein